MKACDKHWKELCDAIDQKGLGHLVSKDGLQAAERLKKELEGQHLIHDPLMGAWLAIMNNAVMYGGTYLLGTDESGNRYCPMCEGDKHSKVKGYRSVSDFFIRKSVEEQYKKAKRAGLLFNN